MTETTKFLFALTLFASTSFAAAATSGRYLASSHDRTILALTRREAAVDHIGFQWEARFDFRLLDARALNANAKLGAASSAADAVLRIANEVHRAQPRSPELFVCPMPQAIVIRQAGQRPCSPS